MTSKADVVVIGAGVSGLTAAYRLRAAGLSVEVLEARQRLGGRAFTRTVSGRSVDLGATWVWDSERHIHALLEELGVQTFAPSSTGLDTYDDGTLQRGHLPASAVPERRIEGGTGALVEALARKVGPVRAGETVTGLQPTGTGVVVHTDTSSIEARTVLAALPPSLVAPWSPELPPLLAHVPVWMGTIAKCVGIFDRPIWTERGFSGRAFSRLGPMSEVHDVSDAGGPALFGFVPQGDGEDLEERVPAQFQRLFGAPPRELIIQRWWSEPCTTNNGQEDQRLFGHAILRQPLLNGRLHLISCETSGVSPGHLEGAVERAETVCRELLGSR